MGIAQETVIPRHLELLTPAALPNGRKFPVILCRNISTQIPAPSRHENFVEGSIGLRDLFSRIRRIRVPAPWYAALLIPPVLVLTVLFSMKTFVSPVFAPNRFFIGVGFGFVAGFFEEIGWMGYAFPKMRRADNAVAPAIALGLLWGA